MSKAAVINWTQAHALELAPHGINVNAICPGLLWTPLWGELSRRLMGLNEELRGLSEREVFERMVDQMVPMKKEQRPEDIGKLAAFLASDDAHQITGQAINIDGGARDELKPLASAGGEAQHGAPRDNDVAALFLHGDVAVDQVAAAVPALALDITLHRQLVAGVGGGDVPRADLAEATRVAGPSREHFDEVGAHKPPNDDHVVEAFGLSVCLVVVDAVRGPPGPLRRGRRTRWWRALPAVVSPHRPRCLR